MIHYILLIRDRISRGHFPNYSHLANAAKLHCPKSSLYTLNSALEVR